MMNKRERVDDKDLYQINVSSDETKNFKEDLHPFMCRAVVQVK